MADYSVDIKLAVAGAKQLKAARAETTALTREINKLNKLANKQSKTLPNSFNTLNKVLGQAKGNLNKVALGTERYFRAIGDVIDKEERLSRAYKKQQTDFKVIERLRSRGLDINKQNIQQIRNELAAEIKLERAKRRTGKASIDKGMAGKLGGAASSAIIGGSFPLLFGQTGAAAVGGGLGGAAGGLIGGQFGFALSILGTAIGSYIQQQDELDRSLLKISNSFITAGDSAGFTRESLKELKMATKMTKDEILGVASAFARYGEAGKAAAFIFGDNPNTFKNLAAMRDTKTLMTAIVDEQNGLSISQQIQLLREAKITSFKDMQLKVNRLILEENYKRELIETRQISRADKLLDFIKQYYKLVLLTQGFNPFSVMEKSFKGIFQKDKLKEELQAVEDLVEQVFPEIFNTSAENAEKAAAKITEYYDELFESLPELQELMSEFNSEVVGMSYSIPSALDSVSAELKKLMSVGYMVTTTANSIGDAFGESFKGIIKGSMTAQQALANFFQKTADHFLDMAAQMIAKQIQMRILGIGLSWFGGGVSGGGSGGGKYLDSNKVPYVDPLSDMGTAADGGYIPGRKPTLVGEEGPEIFMPNSGGTVIPNHDLGGLGGSTNIVVNVDASGSSVEGDEQSGEELGRLIAAAIQSELIKEKRPGGLLS